MRNVTDHKYGDLTSEVVTPRKMDTHESFYVESSPKKKNLDRTASPSNIINASSSEKRKSISFTADKKQMNRGVSASANSAQQQQQLEQQQFQMQQLQQQLQLQQMQMQQFMTSGPPTVDPTSAPGAAPVAAVAAFDLAELKQQISKVISEMGLLSKNKNSNQKPQKTALMAQVENEEKGNKEVRILKILDSQRFKVFLYILLLYCTG